MDAAVDPRIVNITTGQLSPRILKSILAIPEPIHSQNASDELQLVENDPEGSVAKVGVWFPFLGDQREN